MRIKKQLRYNKADRGILTAIKTRTHTQDESIGNIGLVNNVKHHFTRYTKTSVNEKCMVNWITSKGWIYWLESV